MSKLIEGRPIAEKVYADLRGEIAELKKNGQTPGLAVVLVGDNPASRAYVRSKDKMCRDLGIHSVKLELPAVTTQAELLARVEELNRDPAIHGILVQSPPPKQIDEAAIVRALDPEKDVDGFHPTNVAKLVLGDESGFVPCTPLGCQRLLIESGIEISGAHVVVLGRSMIVGKPLALLLMRKGRGGDATVTVAHSRSRRLSARSTCVKALSSSMLESIAWTTRRRSAATGWSGMWHSAKSRPRLQPLRLCREASVQ